MREAIWSRVGPASGLLFFPLIMVGFSIHGYPDIQPTDAQLAKWLASVDANVFRFGVYVQALGTVLLIPFAAWLYVHLRQGARDSLLPAIAMVAAGAGWIVLTLPVNESWVGLVDQARIGLDIRTAQTVVSINQAWFEITGLVFGLMLMAAGVAIIRGGAISRWVGWAAIITGLGSVVSVPLGSASTPAQLLGFLWILAVGGYYTFRPSRVGSVSPTRPSHPSQPSRWLQGEDRRLTRS
ncbi:MAG: DUF4386 domain-containing protein [Candidatus Dormibacteraeota bacterium]|nr:DUF4386 domain-containing protein [Candidatus Dormibacteraeota bacterium]